MAGLPKNRYAIDEVVAELEGDWKTQRVKDVMSRRPKGSADVQPTFDRKPLFNPAYAVDPDNAAMIAHHEAVLTGWLLEQKHADPGNEEQAEQRQLERQYMLRNLVDAYAAPYRKHNGRVDEGVLYAYAAHFITFAEAYLDALIYPERAAWNDAGCHERPAFMPKALIDAKDEALDYGERLMHQRSVRDIMALRPGAMEADFRRGLPLRPLFNMEAIELTEAMPKSADCDPRLSQNECDDVIWAEGQLVSALLKREMACQARPDMLPREEYNHADLVCRSLVEAYRRPYAMRHQPVPMYQLRLYAEAFTDFAVREIRDRIGDISLPGLSI